MLFVVAAVGRLKDDAEKTLEERYASRINDAGRRLSFGPVAIHTEIEGRAGDLATRKADEGQRLLAASEASDWRVVLDETGRQMGSTDFAKMLQGRRDQGVRSMAFLIGGPDGHAPATRSAANLLLSLSPMTLPHGLARVVLLEQIYRAITIIGGHPYHRG